MTLPAGSPFGTHRVVSPPGVLPQAAERLDPDLPMHDDETIVAVDTLNLDAASFYQLRQKYDHDTDRIRSAVLDIIASRGKMHNPETGSGGMLLGTVTEVGPRSELGLAVGDRVASLISLTGTPLRITDGAARWDVRSEQIPVSGRAVLFGHSIAAVMPRDMSEDLALAILDVCGAPALTARLIERRRASGRTAARVVVIGGGKSGSLTAVAARELGATVLMLVPTEREAADLRARDLCDQVLVADATSPLAVIAALSAEGGPADVTVLCVNRPDCEHGAILATEEGGTVVYFSMSTQLAAAALGAESLAKDVEMMIGSGYVPGHAQFALDLVRRNPALARLFEDRIASHAA